MEVELTQHNLLQRGVTPPPEEKVAFYVYKQSKIRVEKPESNAGTENLLSYASEPVAWAPELPQDWHSQEYLSNQPGFGTGTAQQTRNNSSANLASNSFPSMSRLALGGFNNQRNSIDRDLADLEAEVMGGSEVDYNIAGQAVPDMDIASDVQEQSVGQRTPQIQNAPLIDAVSVHSDVTRKQTPVRTSKHLSKTPAKAAQDRLPSIRAESNAPGTPKTTGIHIQIQPPTDPSLSKAPSRRQSIVDGGGASVRSSPRPDNNKPTPAASPSPLRTALAQASRQQPPPSPTKSAATPKPLSRPSSPLVTQQPRSPSPAVTPPVKTPTPAVVAKEPKTKGGKMAKKKAGGKAAKKGKKGAKEEEEEEEQQPAIELGAMAPQTPAPEPPLEAPPVAGTIIENHFSPSGHLQSVIVKTPAATRTPKPLPDQLEPEEAPAPPSKSPGRPASRAPSRAASRPASRAASHMATPAPHPNHIDDDAVEEGWPELNNEWNEPSVTVTPRAVHAKVPSEAGIKSPMKSTRGSHFGGERSHPSDFETAPTGHSRAGSRAADTVRGARSPYQQPNNSLGLAEGLGLDPRLNGGNTEELQEFLASNRPPSRARSRAASEHPLSPARSARDLHDGAKEVEVVSVPASHFRAPSRTGRSERGSSPPRVIAPQDSLGNMWQDFQGGRPVQQPMPEPEPSRTHSRGPSQATPWGPLASIPQPEPAPEPSPMQMPVPMPAKKEKKSSKHSREPAALQTPSVQGAPSLRDAPRDSARLSSIREPSVVAPSPQQRDSRPFRSPMPSPAQPRFPSSPLSPNRGQAIPKTPSIAASMRDRPTSPTAASSVPRSTAYSQSRSRGPAAEHGRQRSVAQELAALETMQEEDDREVRTASPVQRVSKKDAMSVLQRPNPSYAVSPSGLQAETAKSNFHDEELCVLLHAADDPSIPEAVRKAVKKAVRSRVKKLGLENEDQFRLQHMGKGGKHKHRYSYAESSAKAPEWARPLFELLEQAQERLDSLDYKLDSTRPNTQADRRELEYGDEDHQLEDDMMDVRDYEPGSDIEQTPRTPHVPLASQEIDVPPGDRSAPPTGSTFNAQDPRHGNGYEPEDDLEYEDEPHSRGNGVEEELYRLKLKDASEYEQSIHSGAHMPEIAGSEDANPYYGDHRDAATPAPRRAAGAVAPGTSQEVTPASHGGPAFQRPRESSTWGANTGPNWNASSAPSWQLVHSRLLNWTIVWSMSELERALESTERGRQVDECALTVWTTQCYKRYVRVRTTDHPPQKVDRLFVPPNVADAINSAVYNGRHGDACSMLKDLWTPFGFEGMPRLILVLARHRRDANHWVVHRFSIPEGTLCTYDTYPEKALADGRPLGWWFAIRAAWPHAMYPNPDHLVQKLVRIHRPLQLLIDNSIAAAAIWRNLLMGSKAERSVDLVRLRDLIHTEVKAIKIRKEQGKLALPNGSRASWDHQIADA